MKKQSVLIQRAWVFTAILLFVAVAAGLTVFLCAGRSGPDAARETLLPQARALARSAGDDQWFVGASELFEQEGGTVWLAGPDGSTQAALPGSIEEQIQQALDGNEVLGVTSVDGVTCAYAIIPAAGHSAVVAALPVQDGRKYTPLAVIAALTGIFCAVLIGIPLMKRLMGRIVKALSSLRDTAVGVAEGDLALRADETAPGEIGELGAAVNRVSTLLVRNMYQLILERNRLKNVLDGLSEGIIAIDREGTVTHSNPALEHMFVRQKPVPHLPDPRLKVIPDATVWEDFDTVIRTGEGLTRSLTVRDMSIRLIITPIFDELQAIVGAVGLFSDVTQMERLERTRREYVSNISHELRTPLTAVQALMEPLDEGMVTSEEKRRHYYKIILKEVKRLSRLQSGTLAIEKTRIAVDDLIYDVCERYRGIAAEKGLELLVPTDFSRFPKAWANMDRVEQLLIILLDNAIKYTEKGSVSVKGSWDDEKIILSVQDTGVGIAEEDLPYVFDRFYKVDKAHSDRGSGLGLSIASELLNRMDETIWVSSEQGKGTEFSFTLHRNPSQDKANDEDPVD